MLVGSACFDPHTIEEAAATGAGGGGHHLLVEDGFSQTHVPNNCSPNFSSMESSHSYHHHHHHQQQQQQQQQKMEDAMEMGIQHQLNMEMEHCYNAIDNKVANNNNNINIRDQHMMQEAAGAGVGHDLNRALSCDRSNWENINLSYQDHSQQQMHHPGVHEIDIHNLQHGPPNNFGTVSLPVPDASEAPFPHTPDLLHMLPLPRCSSSLLPNSSISFGNTSSNPKSSNLLSSLGLLGDINGGHDVGTPASSIVFDPILPLNLPQHEPPFLRELIHSLPHGYSLGMGSSRSAGSLFSGVDDGETSGGFFQDGGDGRTGYDNGIFEFTADMNCIGKGRVSKNTKHFTTEKQRRVHMNDKFNVLRSLVPNPTKNDRASIVGDAIEYINELKRTVGELKILVEKKRCSRERVKRAKEENGNDQQVNNIKNHDHHVMLEDIDDHHHHHHHPYNGSTLRSSWLHRKSKSSEVDVRIVDDEVTVKLVQQKRINCLLFVSKVLDELQLDLHHVAGGLIGDSYSFLFNSKICEGSTVYAHAIANKLIDVVDKQYAAAAASASGSY